jgi:diadenosine tetraphosphate (Ap4A) HIT family hydrolase
MEVDDCFACAISRHEIQPPGGLFSVSPHWTLNQRVDEPVRPWFVLQTKHHRKAVADLSDAEQDEFGRLLPALSKAIENFTGATHTYAAIFNELGHVHVHLVPRFNGDLATGPALFSTAAPRGIARRVSDTALAGIAEQATFDTGNEPHAVVRCVVALHRWFDRHASPYGPLSRQLWSRRWSGAAFAPVYVGMWLVVLAGLLAIDGVRHLPWWMRLFTAFVAGFRWVDAVLYEVGILLDRSQNWLSGFERSVILAGANLVEVSLIGAIWLLALEWGPGLGATWLHSFSLVTLSGAPIYQGTGTAVAQVATLGGGLVFLGGAIALLLGGLGDRMREVR